MGMEKFVGFKLVQARPMTRGEYNTVRGWALPGDEDGTDEGYLVEHLEQPPNVQGFHGYVSWSPAAVFAASYRSTNGMPFGGALELLKLGYRVAREGWNGKGMWIALSPGRKGLSAHMFFARQNQAFAEDNGGWADVLPCITMKTADGKILMGWQASQSDMLAEDYYIVA